MIHRLRALSIGSLFAGLVVANLAMIAFQFRTPDGERILKHLLFRTVTPIWGGASDALHSIGAFLRVVVSYRQMQAAIDRLEREVERLRFDRAAEAERTARLARLEQILPLYTAYADIGLVSEVMARGFHIWDRSLIIRGGSLDGLRPELPVLCPDGVVGYLLRCGPDYSEVLLVTNPSFAMAGRIPTSGIRGMIHGNGSPTLRLNYVTLSSPVQIGEQLLSTGDEGIFPPGHPIGTISQLGRGGILFQDLDVTPAVDLENLRFVVVLRHPQADGP